VAQLDSHSCSRERRMIEDPYEKWKREREERSRAEAVPPVPCRAASTSAAKPAQPQDGTAVPRIADAQPAMSSSGPAAQHPRTAGVMRHADAELDRFLEVALITPSGRGWFDPTWSPVERNGPNSSLLVHADPLAVLRQVLGREP
jgi:hypothetical protein